MLQGLQAADRVALLALCRRGDMRHFECRRPRGWLLAAEYLCSCALNVAAGGLALGFVLGQVGYELA